ncbi:cellobiose-specific PTS system IIC component [Levilactobacillus brevis]|nr:cellobiose-specific PTS system IIC component [Levilactobacillus brevis]
MAAGTPAPLLAHLGTGGNWRAFALALVDLAISTAIYWPFLKWLWLAEAQGGDEK